jgi:hypothetical protein
MRPALLVALLLLAPGCGSTHRSVTVSVAGRIGPLHVDRSDRGDLVAFAGKPEAERHGEEFDSLPYQALGYGCSEKSTLERWPLLQKGPYCRTVFFINVKTGKLGNLFTSSAGYVEPHGVRPGMGEEVAERRLHRHLRTGCEENFYFDSRAAALTVAFAGGVTARVSGRVTGAHVFALVLHGRRSDVGVFDCL